MQIVNVAIPTLGQLVRCVDRRGPVDGRRLPPQPRSRDPRLGLGGRPDRDEARLPDRPRHLHARVGLCGAAQSLGELIGARVLQGVGGGMLTPVATALLFRTYPARAADADHADPDRPDPDRAGKRPADRRLSHRERLVAVGVLGQPPGRPRHVRRCACSISRTRREHVSGRLDVVGMILGAVGLECARLRDQRGPDKGWASTPILVAGAVGLVVSAAFVRFELRHPEPLLRLHLLGDRLFREHPDRLRPHLWLVSRLPLPDADLPAGASRRNRRSAPARRRSSRRSASFSPLR